MADFKKAIERVLKWEGGDTYTNDPDDPGGGTRYGVTEATARAIGYTGPMQDLPYETAMAAYERYYWEPLSLDLIEHQGIADQLLQGAVNQGTGRWAKFMQEACNITLPADLRLKVDGQVGDDTVCGVNLVILMDKVSDYSAALFNMQENRYRDLISKNAALDKYRVGWHNRAADFLTV